MRAPTTPPVPSLVSTSTGGTQDSTPMPSSPATDAPEVVIQTDEEGLPAEDLLHKIDPDAEARAKQLNFLLEKSTVYAKIIGDRMERQQIEKLQAQQRAAARQAGKDKKVATAETSGRAGMRHREAKEAPAPTKRRKRNVKVEEEAEDPKDSDVKQEEPAVKLEDEGDEGNKQYSFAQPALVTGAKLRDYQLAGVQWMISLYENGLNGILADEMGLGKTLQTISFLAHLRAKGTWGPFLIVCPLSVLFNWVSEFEKFAPSIPVVMYHGTPEQRAELRATRMQAPSSAGVGNVRGSRGTKRPRAGQNTTATFPIVVTTYEICMRDKSYLNGYQWKFIVVDEGHRLKNFDCKLVRELKSYSSANRMILTGTPLHNNLAELWALLNFILPFIFDDLDAFQQWFNFDTMADDGLLSKSSVVTSLHGILKPFLLRRLKSDVEKELPPKKEYLLFAPLTQLQKDIYQAILNRSIRQYLIEKKSGTNESNQEDDIIEIGDSDDETPHSHPKRKAAREVDYRIEENDDKYLRQLEEKAHLQKTAAPTAVEIGRNYMIKQATKSVNNMRLQNLAMQLRKVSSHPFLFDWPHDAATGELVINDDLVNASGKMLLLNRLLETLFARGHKVLLFSQFTTMLDVIEDWATLYKKWRICRIDGGTSQNDRREQMDDFNNGGDSPDACKLFLLSTRAGGLGINLVAADTVIFFDQDWNPQMDLQAQDRAHRIGQTKPVLIFRLVAAHTIETKVLQKASGKRKLEALVIQQGKFGKLVDENGKVLLGRSNNKAQSTVEMARMLLDLEGEEINIVREGDTIISDKDLDMLLDRSPAAFAREKGWAAGIGGVSDQDREKKLAAGEKTAFEVYVPQRDEAADGLAHMFEEGEEVEEK